MRLCWTCNKIALRRVVDLCDFYRGLSFGSIILLQERDISAENPAPGLPCLSIPSSIPSPFASLLYLRPRQGPNRNGLISPATRGKIRPSKQQRA